MNGRFFVVVIIVVVVFPFVSHGSYECSIPTGIQFYDFVYWFNNEVRVLNFNSKYWFYRMSANTIRNTLRDRHNVAIFTSRPRHSLSLVLSAVSFLEGQSMERKKKRAWGKCWPSAKYTLIPNDIYIARQFNIPHSYIGLEIVFFYSLLVKQVTINRYSQLQWTRKLIYQEKRKTQ